MPCCSAPTAAGGSTSRHPLAAVAGVRAALWGDLDNDGRTDAVLVRAGGGSAVWRQSAPNVWRDVTASSRALTPRLDGVDGALVDADHDGDLDIWLTNASLSILHRPTQSLYLTA